MTTRVDPQGKFLTPRFEVQNNQFQPSLLIADSDWWDAHTYEVYEWMDEHLTNGRHQNQGMLIQFGNEQDRLMFLMRWGG